MRATCLDVASSVHCSSHRTGSLHCTLALTLSSNTIDIWNVNCSCFVLGAARRASRQHSRANHTLMLNICELGIHALKSRLFTDSDKEFKEERPLNVHASQPFESPRAMLAAFWLFVSVPCVRSCTMPSHTPNHRVTSRSRAITAMRSPQDSSSEELWSR